IERSWILTPVLRVITIQQEKETNKSHRKLLENWIGRVLSCQLEVGSGDNNIMDILSAILVAVLLFFVVQLITFKSFQTQPTVSPLQPQIYCGHVSYSEFTLCLQSKVTHTRDTPKRNKFTYKLFMMYSEVSSDP